MLGTPLQAIKEKWSWHPLEKLSKLDSINKDQVKIANGLKPLAKTSQKNNKMMIEEERKVIFHFEERKPKRIGNMSSLLIKYMLIHCSHNSCIVFNLVIKQAVAPRELLIHINSHKMM